MKGKIEEAATLQSPHPDGYRAYWNSRFGQAKICHQERCEPGETNTVAVVLSSFQEEVDLPVAQYLAQCGSVAPKLATLLLQAKDALETNDEDKTKAALQAIRDFDRGGY